MRSELLAIFRIRTMLYVLVGVSILLFAVSGIGFGLPVYLSRYAGFSTERGAGVAALILATAGATGTLLGGRRADKLVVRGGVAARITAVSNAALVCVACFGASLAVPTVPVRLLLQWAAVAAIATGLPTLRAATMDVTPAHSRGVAMSAFALTSTVLGTAFAPIVVGAISDVTGSLVAAFWIVMPLICVGAFALRRACHTASDDAAAIVAFVSDDR
jgi:MFS family permease